MRAVVQRVTSASVRVDDRVVGQLELGQAHQGLLAFVGVTHTDDIETAAKLASKIWQLRILDEERSLAETGAPILVVSQFTLYADTRKGRRPSWFAAAPAAVSEPIVEAFVAALREQGAAVQTGVFGADMKSA